MATATATLTVNAFPAGVDNTQRRSIVHGICALSASGTYVTNGIPLNWGTMKDASTNSAFAPTWAGSQPNDAFFYTTTLAAPGYAYTFDATHNTLRITNAGTELANAAAITADTIAFEAEFVR